MRSTEKSLCESEVFEEVYKSNITSLHNYIYYKCGTKEVAEDIAQDCFVKLWKDCSNFALDTIRHLLFKMANNLFLNSISHEKVKLKHQKLTGDNNHVTKVDPEYLLEEKEYLEKMQTAIGNLRDRDREVFLLNRIDKKKYREISALLNISIKTVEKRMSSALKQLRQQVEGF